MCPQLHGSPYSVTARSLLLQPVKEAGRVGGAVYYLSIHQAFFFFKGKKTATPKELSEVLKVNGSIYIAINSLYKELPLRTVQQLTEAPARARQTGASNKEGQ